MNRAHAIAALRSGTLWDVLVIGGGATGLGIAVDAASRGYATALVEARDFAHGTSSRSTKLIHGGVRYLRSGNLALVQRGLHERARLRQNAPQLVHDLTFVMPAYAWYERLFYGAGLKLYDTLAGARQTQPSRLLTRAETLDRLPTLKPEGLRGGVLYHDCQFDDARLACVLAQTACHAGAVVANYVRVQSLLKKDGRVAGVIVREEETRQEFELRARSIINATGVFADEIRRWDEPSAAPLLSLSQGAHIVLPSRFLPKGDALMIPKTSDGRLLFAVPWQGRVLLGTTDTPVSHVAIEPRPLAEEIRFLLEHAAHYFTPAPSPGDVLSMYAGLRPLVLSPGTRTTASLSRDHLIAVSSAGLLTIVGGKWTTYRWMAEDAVNRVALLAGLPARPCRTADLPLTDGVLRMEENPTTPLHPALPVRAEDVRRAAREEMARTVEDVLARRTRALVLDAKASLAIAPAVARLLATELGWTAERERQSLADFGVTARGCLPTSEPEVPPR